MNNEQATHEQIRIKQLKNELLLLQWFILSLGLITLIIFSINNHLFENIIFLPMIGFIGYLFTRRIFVLPSITTCVLLLSNFLKDLISPVTDTVWNYLFYFFLFFSMTLIGSLCGYFLLKSIRYYKKIHSYKKFGVCCAWCALGILALWLLIDYVSIHGNPISTYYTEYRMQKYLKATYPNETISLSHTYYQHKTGKYTSTASLYDEAEALQSFHVYLTNGKISDDYVPIYLEDEPNEYRLNAQIEEELCTLLSDHAIHYNDVQSNLLLEKGNYDQINFDKGDFNKPLALTFILFTKDKQTPEDFGRWCESIRSLLIDEGYCIDHLCFQSSPHWEENSLELYLSGKSLTKPIKNVLRYKGYKDIGAKNGLSPSDHNIELYNNYYKDPELQERFVTALTPEFAPIYVKAVSSSLGKAELDITLTGKRISIDSFAAKVMTIFNKINSEDLLSGHSFQAITFKYSWGTSAESYEYTIYPENEEELTESVIIETLLDNSPSLPVLVGK